jgi:hypothetical protein
VKKKLNKQLINVIRTKEDEENRSLTKSEKEVYRRLLLLEGDPPEAVDTEAIVWELGARVPGRFDQGPAGKGRIAEVMPHLRESVVHPEIPNQKLLTMGKFYGNWIDFKIIARDSKQALRRLLWFEEAMDSFHWYFRFFGFRAIEVGVGNKEKIKIDNLDLIQYPITYFVRSEDVFHITTQDLKKLIITTNVSKS